MGHYDECREGYCGCGQAEGVIWACGREGCTKYHTWLRDHNPPAYKKLMAKLKARQEAEEERRVTARQIARRTKQIADAAKQEAEQ